MAQVDSLNFLLLIFWFIILFLLFYFLIFVKIIPGISLNFWVRFFFFEFRLLSNQFLKKFSFFVLFLKNKSSFLLFFYFSVIYFYYFIF